MANKKLLKDIKVLGSAIKVTRESDMSDMMGEFIADESKIKISSKLEYNVACETLFHEVIHAAFFVSGQSELLKDSHEEAIIRMLEKALMPFVDKNKLSGRK